MIKILSFKTRRSDLSFAAFRSHYEERHVPLGLSHIEHFRWRKYVRNYVVGPALDGVEGVDFDCMTEFWVADREDQKRTALFVESAEFSALDQDDRRFLDVTRRLSFEVDEELLFGSRRDVDSIATDRLAIFIERPGPVSAEDFARGVSEFARALVAEREGEAARIGLDLPRPESTQAGGSQAIVSVWAGSNRGRREKGWPAIEFPVRAVRLASVETKPEALFGGGEGPSNGERIFPDASGKLHPNKEERAR